MTTGYFLGIVLFYVDPDQAEPLLIEYLSVVPDGEQDVRRYYAIALLSEVHGVRGELEVAERLANEARQVARRQALEEHPPTEQVHVALGIAPLARGELDAAEEHFERGVALARRGGDLIECAHALLWLARLRARQHDRAGAAAALAAAREAVPELGEPSLRGLLHTVELELADDDHAAIPASDEEEPLSDAELRVLRLLPGDMTYREIAANLYLSLNTVRSHALRLRRKLGVSSRAEVVARARKLGLL